MLTIELTDSEAQFVVNAFKLLDGPLAQSVRIKTLQAMGKGIAEIIKEKIANPHSTGIGTATTIEMLQKGDYFRFPGQTRVYVRAGYIGGKTYQYSAYRFDDVNHFICKDKGTIVEIGFDF